eukprot:g41724.t1
MAARNYCKMSSYYEHKRFAKKRRTSSYTESVKLGDSNVEMSHVTHEVDSILPPASYNWSGSSQNCLLGRPERGTPQLSLNSPERSTRSFRAASPGKYALPPRRKNVPMVPMHATHASIAPYSAEPHVYATHGAPCNLQTFTDGSHSFTVAPSSEIPRPGVESLPAPQLPGRSVSPLPSSLSGVSGVSGSSSLSSSLNGLPYLSKQELERNLGEALKMLQVYEEERQRFGLGAVGGDKGNSRPEDGARMGILREVAGNAASLERVSYGAPTCPSLSGVERASLNYTNAGHGGSAHLSMHEPGFPEANPQSSGFHVANMESPSLRYPSTTHLQHIQETHHHSRHLGLLPDKSGNTIVHGMAPSMQGGGGFPTFVSDPGSRYYDHEHSPNMLPRGLMHDEDKLADAIVCPTCDKTFTSRFSRKRHMKTHNKEVKERKLCACRVCGKEYTEIGNLYRHLRIKHEINTFTTVKRGRPKKNEPVKRGEYVCIKDGQDDVTTTTNKEEEPAKSREPVVTRVPSLTGSGKLSAVEADGVLPSKALTGGSRVLA